MLTQEKQKIDSITLTNFKIDSVVAEGGMGKVYLATDLVLDRQVAIKIQKIQNTFYNTKQILNEAKILAQLNHTNIVQLYSIKKYGEQLALVMEYVNGPNLLQLNKESQPSQIEKIKWLYDISKGFSAAHYKKCIHCDLKLSNILIDEYQNAKIADFGIAKLEQHNINTNDNFVSLASVTPEAIQNKEIDFSSDLFSFGVLAFELMAGYSPFDFENTRIELLDKNQKSDILQKIAHPKNAKDILPDIPKELAELINQLIQYKKSERLLDSHRASIRLKNILTHESQKSFSQEDTIPINNSPLLASTLPPSKLPLKLNTGLLKGLSFKISLFFCLLAILISYFFLQPLNDNHLKRVIVLKPQINSDHSLSHSQERLIFSAIDSAARDFIVESGKIRLIANNEVDFINKDTKTLAKATGASDIISSVLTCQNKLCHIEISLLSSVDDTVKAYKQWPVHFKNYRDIYGMIKINLANFFSLPINNGNNYLTDTDFQKYLELYYNIRYTNYDFELLNSDLKVFIENNPYVYTSYSLYRELILNRYLEKNETELLENLTHILDNAPVKYKQKQDYHINRFWLNLSSNKKQKALQSIELLKDKGTDGALLKELEAVFYFENNNYNIASKYYQQALELRPSTYLMYNLALSYWWQGKTTQSIATAKQLLTIIPDDYKTNRLLGSLYLFIGELDFSIDNFSKSIAQFPQSIDQNNLSIAYMLKGEYSKAYELSKSLVKNNPNNATWQLNLADLKMLLNKNIPIKEQYERVITLNKNKTDVQSLLENAQAFVRLGHSKLALKSLHQAKTLTPENLDVYYTASIIYTTLQENQSALFNIEEALNKGLGSAWFSMPWFNSLCSNNQFKMLMSQHGKELRCEA